VFFCKDSAFHGLRLVIASAANLSRRENLASMLPDASLRSVRSIPLGLGHDRSRKP
jgi:hypothetical protein